MKNTVALLLLLMISFSSHAQDRYWGNFFLDGRKLYYDKVIEVPSMSSEEIEAELIGLFGSLSFQKENFMTDYHQFLVVGCASHAFDVRILIKEGRYRVLASNFVNYSSIAVDSPLRLRRLESLIVNFNGIVKLKNGAIKELELLNGSLDRYFDLNHENQILARTDW